MDKKQIELLRKYESHLSSVKWDENILSGLMARDRHCNETRNTIKSRIESEKLSAFRVLKRLMNELEVSDE